MSPYHAYIIYTHINVFFMYCNCILSMHIFSPVWAQFDRNSVELSAVNLTQTCLVRTVPTGRDTWTRSGSEIGSPELHSLVTARIEFGPNRTRQIWYEFGTSLVSTRGLHQLRLQPETARYILRRTIWPAPLFENPKHSRILVNPSYNLEYIGLNSKGGGGKNEQLPVATPEPTIPFSFKKNTNP